MTINSAGGGGDGDGNLLGAAKRSPGTKVLEKRDVSEPERLQCDGRGIERIIPKCVLPIAVVGAVGHRSGWANCIWRYSPIIASAVENVGTLVQMMWTNSLIQLVLAWKRT